jgi:hypothetical protein
MANPTPDWVKSENASVLDPMLLKVARWIAQRAGVDDLQGQVLGLMGGMVPKGQETMGPLGEAVERLVSKGKGAIKAFHGSPHDFEKFDTSKIGTGEGAQAYGHGLYFAEKEGTAKAYRDNFQSFKDAAVQLTTGERLNVPTWVQARMDDGRVDSVIADFSNRLQEMRSTQAQHLQPWLVDEQITNTERILKAAHAFKAGQAKTVPAAHMYEVAIDADPDQFLDWDAPLRQQSESVKQAIQREWLAHPEIDASQTGRQIYQKTADSLPLKVKRTDAAGLVSQQLKDAGIPGIKYLDSGSRAAGEGSRNYVVFDDKLVSILKKYGVALPMIEALRRKSQQQGGKLPEADVQQVMHQ